MKQLAVTIIFCVSVFGFKGLGQSADFSIASGTVIDSVFCAPLNDSVQVAFKALYKVVSDTSYRWNLGNDSTAVGTSAKMWYRSGIYTVSLTLVPKKGTSFSLKHALFIRPHPNANFTFADTFSLGKLTYIFRSGKAPDSIFVGTKNSRLDSIKYNYTWTLNDSLGSKIFSRSHSSKTSVYPYRDTLINEFPQNGHYTMLLKVTDYFGCSDSYSAPFIVAEKLQIPNAFSPNGDGLNDFFQVQTNGRTVYRLMIFTQTGVLVHKSEAASILWDGYASNGSLAYPGTYFYVIEPIKNPEGQTKRTGFVMLFTNK